MEKEFIPYEQSLSLKELGFDKPCFANYSPNFKLYHPEKNYLFNLKSTMLGNSECKAPTFSQAFRWFREKYGLYGLIDYHLTPDLARYTILKENDLVAKVLMAFGKYEKAELECLKKLIEIVKEK